MKIIQFTVSLNFQPPQDTTRKKELGNNCSENHNTFGLQKSYRLLELPEKHRVVLQICCSFPQIGPIALMEWVHFLASFSQAYQVFCCCLFVLVHQFLRLLSFLKGQQLYLDSCVSSKSNYLSEGNLEKQYLSQIRVWLTKFYDTKCLQAKNLKNWSKVFKDWIQLVQSH